MVAFVIRCFPAGIFFVKIFNGKLYTIKIIKKQKINTAC